MLCVTLALLCLKGSKCRQEKLEATRKVAIRAARRCASRIATRIGDINYGKYRLRLLEEAVYYIIPDVGRTLGGATANLY